MNSDLKYDKINIELRRGKVLELLTKGYSQRNIAEKLNVSDSLISLDIQWIREQAKDTLRSHLSDKLPFEFARAMAGINDILRRAHEILDSTKDPKLQYQYMTLIMQLWGTIMSMATDGGVIERAFKKMEQLESTPKHQEKVAENATFDDKKIVEAEETEEELEKE